MRYLLFMALVSAVALGDRIANYQDNGTGYSFLMFQEDSVSTNGVGQTCTQNSKYSTYGRLLAIEAYFPNTGGVIRVYGTHPISGTTQNIFLESNSASGWQRYAVHSTDVSTVTNEYGLIVANALTNTVPEWLPGMRDWTMLTTNCWTAGAKALLIIQE